jgi:hypothetical protein
MNKPPEPSVPLSAIRALVQQDEALLAKEPECCPCRYCTHLRHRLDAFREVLAALCPAPPEDRT